MRELLIALAGVSVGAVLAGVVGWWTKTYARNARTFAAARMLHHDLKRVRDKLDEAQEEGTWHPLDDLSLPSWGETQRTALAIQLSPTEWKSLEDAVFAIGQIDMAKQRKLRRLTAVSRELEGADEDDLTEDERAQLAKLKEEMLLADAGQLSSELSDNLKRLCTDTRKLVNQAVALLNWPRVPPPLSKRRLRWAIAVAVVAALAIAVGSSVSAYEARQPGPPLMSDRVAHSIEQYFPNSTHQFAACELVRIDNVRFLCDVQVQGERCSSVSNISFAERGRAITFSHTLRAKLSARCLMHILAEQDDREDRLYAARVDKLSAPGGGITPTPANAPMPANSVKLRLLPR